MKQEPKGCCLSSVTMTLTNRFRLCWFFWVILFAPSLKAQDFERSLDAAQISVELFGGQPVAYLGLQPLPWRWDTHFAKQRGVARFELAFSLSPKEFARVGQNSDGLGLQAVQMGNRYRYSINGAGWRYVGWDEANTQYRSKPRWHSLPHTDMRLGHNWLVLELRMEPANDAGLSAIQIGDIKTSAASYQSALNIRQNSALIVSFSSFLIGLFSLVMWRITKERLFALTCFAELGFATRQLAIFVDYPPLPTWLWNGLFASLFAIYVGLVGQISTELVEKKSFWIERLTVVYLWLSVPFLMAGYALGDYRFYRFWLAVMITLTAVLVVRVTYYAIKTSNLNVRLYTFAAWFAMLLGLYDFFMVQTSAAGLGKVRLGMYTTFLFNLSLAIVIVRKFMSSKQALFEAEIKLKVESNQATMAERQRIMSDIHDTVGSQLVGVLGMIRSGASRDQLEAETSQALEDLRIAIDAIQPVNGNLAAVLATLRHRLEPRLQAHGLTLLWQVDDLPRMANMTPQMIQHVQRIVLEVLTNVIKHANATTVTFSACARGQPPRAIIEISDDGIGFNLRELAHQGQGLSNIRARANAINAKVSFSKGKLKGAGVTLTFAGQPLVSL